MNISVNSSFSSLSLAAGDKIRQIKSHSTILQSAPGISDIKNSELKELGEFHDTAIKSSKHLITATNLHGKFEKAVDAMAGMQEKLADASALINGYNGTREQLPLLQSAISEALRSIADGLTSTYEGGFTFAPPGLEHLNPVTKAFVENPLTLAADGTKTDNYIVYRSTVDNKEISNGVKINASINPGDDAFLDLISGLHAIKDQLDALTPNDPMPAALNAAAVTRLNNGVGGLSLLVQNTANRRDQVADAIEKAETLVSEAQDGIEEVLEIDPLAFSTKLEAMKQELGILMSIIASSMQRSAEMVAKLSNVI
ncbi:MAG UNVERIFIED_CONTAM: DUF1320 domain-containing protein [Rickettsiaceae bacterium]|jgi:hypothetical protein